jgi:hypothetical protein
VFNLFFSVSAVYFMAKYLHNNKPTYLYLGSILIGFGFLCKYITLILIPIFLLTIILTTNIRSILNKEMFLAGIIFLLVVSVDILWNLQHRNTAGLYYTNFTDHIRRIGGIGLSRQPFVFYLRDFRNILYTYQGRQIFDPVVEYPAMNSLVGAVLLSGVAYSTFSYPLGRFYPKLDLMKQDKYIQIIIFLLIWFWCIFGFFLLIKPGIPKERMDPVVWFWVDMTLFPSAMLVGFLYSKMKGTLKIISIVLLALMTSYSIFNIIVW